MLTLLPKDQDFVELWHHILKRSREGRSLFARPPPTDGPSEHSLYEVELIERWAQGSLLVIGTVDTKGWLVSTGKAGQLSVQIQ